MTCKGICLLRQSSQTSPCRADTCLPHPCTASLDRDATCPDASPPASDDFFFRCYFTLEIAAFVTTHPFSQLLQQQVMALHLRSFTKRNPSASYDNSEMALHLLKYTKRGLLSSLLVGCANGLQSASSVQGLVQTP
eukprot:TRINITY_DN2340_c0_g5_i1.p1 TRINITY_DN2340_c0_g5~~TRINITY_DN2340_c0_g5_i1.p1  ORF type:complete len:136 (+),score=7.59 TRINITY_DN2340_c0_g5_i1:119-526(+)